jgi:hypothetical protein
VALKKREYNKKRYTAIIDIPYVMKFLSGFKQDLKRVKSA